MASAVSSASTLAEEFVRFAVERGAIRFGEFTTKAGRRSPYFFNAGLFSDGASLRRLCAYYARALLESGIAFDMLFGPAYKGIVLAAGVAIALAEQGVNVPFAYNRKEAKDHGEGGLLVGAPLRGRVMMVDDVISAGTSVRESMELIRASGAQLAGVVISLDRMERGSGELSAVQEVSERLQIPVISVADLDALVGFLRAQGEYAAQLDAVLRYRRQYGVGVVS